VVIIGHGKVLADATVQEIRERSGTATLEEAFLQVLGDTERRELMRTLFIVFAKEFLENLRDRRTLLSALLFGPLFGPILFGLMVSRHAGAECGRVGRALEAHDLGKPLRAGAYAVSQSARRQA